MQTRQKSEEVRYFGGSAAFFVQVVWKNALSCKDFGCALVPYTSVCYYVTWCYVLVLY